MELDAKQKVLIAIYTEYQKDLPQMERNIKASVLGLNNDVFKIAISKLMNEGLITGVHVTNDGNSNIPAVIWLNDLKMSREGITYVEEKLSIEKTLDGEGKLREISKKALSWGWDQIKDIAARTLAEMTKK